MLENRINDSILRVRELISNKPKPTNITAEASELERTKMIQLFKQMNITEYSFTDPNGYDEQDGQYTNKYGKTFLFETKVRRFPSTEYSDTMLEMKKIYNLGKAADKINATPLLFIFFTDNKVAVFNPDKVTPTQKQITKRRVTEDKYSNKITEMSNFYDLSHPSVKIIDLND